MDRSRPLRDGHVGRVRAAEEQRHTETLGGADGDIRALLTRRGDQGQRQQVSGDRDQCTAFLGRGDDLGVVEHAAGDAGLLQHDAVDDALGQALGQVGDLHLEAQGLGAALHDRDGLRHDIGIQDGLAVLRLPCSCWRGASSARPRPRRWLHPAGTRWRSAGPRGPGPWSGSSAAPRAGPGKSPAGTGCRRCTRRALRGCCGGSPAGSRCRSSPGRSSARRSCSCRELAELGEDLNLTEGVLRASGLAWRMESGTATSTRPSTVS